jgi:uncharacterized protein (TIGR02246 family)
MRIHHRLGLIGLPIVISVFACSSAVSQAQPSPAAASATAVPPTAVPSAASTALPTPTSTPTVDYEAEVRAVTDRFFQSIKDMNADAYADLFMPDGLVVLGDRYPNRYRETIRANTKAYWRVSIRFEDVTWTIDSVDIDLPMATVRVTSKLRAIGVIDDARHNQIQTSTLIWLRGTDGKWLLEFDYEPGG